MRCPSCHQHYQTSVEDVHICSDCGIGESELLALPEVYANGYAENYYNLIGTEKGDKIVAHRAETLTRLTSRMSIMDFGCGTGVLIREARKLGLNMFGYEPMPSFRTVHHRLGVEQWVQTDLRDAASMGMEFMTFFDSFEHLDRPDKILELFKPKMILLAIPIFYGKLEEGLTSWKHYKPKEHVWYFTPEGLTNMLQAHGYVPTGFSTEECNLGRLDSITVVARRVR